MYNASGKGVRQERDFFKRDRNDTSSCSESASQVFSSENDIRNFVRVPLTDADRRKVLFNCWTLLQVSRFQCVTVGAQNRSFQKQWLNESTWLAYSNIYNGAFCKWCVVFAPQTVSRCAKPPGSLVSEPHCNYKKAKEHYNNHQNCYYHKLRVAMFDNFVQTDADKSRDIRNALDSSLKKAVKKNRNRLSHIIRTTEFCGRQEIPVYVSLTILGTLPVSSATSERSFSTMRRLKTYLRSSIGNERMTGLALLSTHKDRQIDREKIMNDFVASGNRRSDFVL